MSKRKVIPVVEIMGLIQVVVGAVEKIEGIFSTGFFNFLCKKKEEKAKAQILKSTRYYTS